MDVDIYRIVDRDGDSFLHSEVCRSCAEKYQKKGFKIEFDGHLYKYIEEIDGTSFYIDGSDDANPEITCSLCENYLVSKHNQPLKLN
jgi:hypothetical protein